jgi:hypothetical protein
VTEIIKSATTTSSSILDRPRYFRAKQRTPQFTSGRSNNRRTPSPKKYSLLVMNLLGKVELNRELLILRCAAGRWKRKHDPLSTCTVWKRFNCACVQTYIRPDVHQTECNRRRSTSSTKHNFLGNTLGHSARAQEQAGDQHYKNCMKLGRETAGLTYHLRDVRTHTCTYTRGLVIRAIFVPVNCALDALPKLARSRHAVIRRVHRRNK